jgi:hypothetical protein
MPKDLQQKIMAKSFVIPNASKQALRRSKAFNLRESKREQKCTEWFTLSRVDGDKWHSFELVKSLIVNW